MWNSPLWVRTELKTQKHKIRTNVNEIIVCFNRVFTGQQERNSGLFKSHSANIFLSSSHIVVVVLVFAAVKRTNTKTCSVCRNADFLRLVCSWCFSVCVFGLGDDTISILLPTVSGSLKIITLAFCRFLRFPVQLFRNCDKFLWKPKLMLTKQKSIGICVEPIK